MPYTPSYRCPRASQHADGKREMAEQVDSILLTLRYKERSPSERITGCTFDAKRGAVRRCELNRPETVTQPVGKA